jgi:hypothetical protein
MLQFYMATGDFTKRLTDVTANSKFATPLSGPKSQVHHHTFPPPSVLRPSPKFTGRSCG